MKRSRGEAEVVMRSMSSWVSAGCLVAVSALVGCEQSPTMSVASPTVSSGEEIVVHFDRPIGGKASNVHWMTLLPIAASDESTVGRFVVDHGKTMVTIPTGASGNFEVRLYDQYPSEDHHLIAKVPVRVVDRTMTVEAPRSPR
jgi:hypothetical protein